MKEVPAWIIKVIEIEKLECRNCNRIFGVVDLMSVGIQESSKAPYQDTLCIGLFCSKCKELVIFELKEMSLLHFAFEILEQETETRDPSDKKSKPIDKKNSSSENKSKRKKRVKKSKITAKEVKESVKFLKEAKSHEEFMLAMGMSFEELQKYNYKKTKPEK
jgi:hypothetical protein